MFKRIALMIALLIAPLALSPQTVDAQERGTEQAAAAAADGLATSAENGRPTTLPPGMQDRPADEPLPPGILLTREPPAEEPVTEPAPDSESESESEECPAELKLIDGTMKLVDCHGNVIEG